MKLMVTHNAPMGLAGAAGVGASQQNYPRRSRLSYYLKPAHYKSGRYSFFKYLLEVKVCLTTNYK
jgi:hypothetical protein